MIVQGLIAGAVHSAGFRLAGEEFGGAVVASVAANLLASLQFALVVVVIYFELSSSARPTLPAARDLRLVLLLGRAAERRPHPP